MTGDNLVAKLLPRLRLNRCSSLPTPFSLACPNGVLSFRALELDVTTAWLPRDGLLGLPNPESNGGGLELIT